jgi:hypothetical protein
LSSESRGKRKAEERGVKISSLYSKLSFLSFSLLLFSRRFEATAVVAVKANAKRQS